jgi:predicted alpha/beta hydrolase family esterase
MARYLLLHGAGGIGFDHWLVWLSTELRARGHEARMRKLPTPSEPQREAWQATMLERLGALAGGGDEQPAASGKPPGERGVSSKHGNMTSGDALVESAGSEPPGDELVVVAHSLSTLLWLLHAADVTAGRTPAPTVRADRVALVAPPHLPAGAASHGWAMPQPSAIDPSSVARHTRIAVSRDDPYWPRGGSIPALVQPLGLPLDDLGLAGHVEPADGYGPWPSMLAWCLGEAEAIAPN